MSREIKFRAWDKDREVMIGRAYPNNWENNKDEWYADIAYMDLCGIESFNGSSRYTLMQYTGLHDKSGKEIFEGDVVNVAHYADPVIVFWSEPHAQFRFGRRGAATQIDKTDWLFDTDSIEVIGNVHENPELLK